MGGGSSEFKRKRGKKKRKYENHQTLSKTQRKGYNGSLPSPEKQKGKDAVIESLYAVKRMQD